jgi:hypothetical protein
MSTIFRDFMDDGKKAKQKEYARKYYQANKEKTRLRTQRSRARYTKEFIDFKSRLACTKCGFNHYAALDFHHVIRNPANKKITDLIRAGRIDFAMEEIMNKCIVLCANCHRIHHYEENKKPPSSVT